MAAHAWIQQMVKVSHASVQRSGKEIFARKVSQLNNYNKSVARKYCFIRSGIRWEITQSRNFIFRKPENYILRLLQFLPPKTKYLPCLSDVDDCASNPCHNGATCIDGDGWHSCTCAPGFTGPVCKININECISTPCRNGGTCRDKIDDFECICPPGKSGALCQGKIGRNVWP